MVPSNPSNPIKMNRREKIGYRVTRVAVKGAAGLSYDTFASGWLREGKVYGRPVDLLVRPDGSLWVSDDYRGAVYRIFLMRNRSDE